MGSQEIDTYLAGLDNVKRATLETVRDRILAVVPDADQCIAYGAPAFRVRGKAVAGFAAYASHLSYLPHSGNVTSLLADRLREFEVTKGAVKFPIDTPLSAPLVKALVQARLAEIDQHRHR